MAKANVRVYSTVEAEADTRQLQQQQQQPIALHWHSVLS